MEGVVNFFRVLRLGRHNKFVEPIVVALLLFFCCLYGTRALVDWRLNPYDGHIMSPGLMWALGHGYCDLSSADRDYERVVDFCKGKTETLVLEHQGEEKKTSALSDIQRTHLYLGCLAGFLWRVFGVHADVIKYLLLFLYCLNIFLVYLLCRNIMGRLSGTIVTLIYISSPSMLEYLVSVRDFSKAPLFTVTFLVLLLLLKRPPTRRCYFFLGILLPLCLGLGLGFRRDMIVPASLALPVLAFIPGPLIHFRHRLLMVVSYVSILAVLSIPVGAFSRAVQGNDNDPDIVVCGFSRTVVRTLPLSRPSYTKGYPVLLDQAPYLLSQTAARTGATMSGEQYKQALASPNADALFVAAYLKSMLQTFPRDLVIRAFAAVNFLLQGRGIALPGPLNELMLFTPLVAAILLLTVAMKSPWRATLILYLILVFCGYTSLNFQGNYVFHLYYIPLLIWGSALPALWGIPGAWKTYSAELRRFRLILIRGLLWGVFMIAPAVGIIMALGFIQIPRVTRIRDAYCSAERFPVTPKVSSWNGATLYGVDVQDEALMPNAFGRNTSACNVFMVELVYPGEPMTLGMSYYSPAADMFSYYVNLGLKDVKTGDHVQIFIPAFEDYALPPDTDDYLLFNGFVVPEGCESTIRGIFRLDYEGLYPLTLAVAKAGDGFIPYRRLDLFYERPNEIFVKGNILLGDFYDKTGSGSKEGRPVKEPGKSEIIVPTTAALDSSLKISRYMSLASEKVSPDGVQAACALFGQMLEVMPGKYGAFLQLFYRCAGILEISPLRFWSELNGIYSGSFPIQMLERHAIYLNLKNITQYEDAIPFLSEHDADILAPFDQFQFLGVSEISAYLNGCVVLADYLKGVGREEESLSLYRGMAQRLEEKTYSGVIKGYVVDLLNKYLADFWFKAGEYDKALQIDRAKFIHAVIPAYGDHADCFFENGDFALAAEYYQRAIVLGSEDLRHYLNLGRAYHKAGEHDAALEMYFKVLEKAPESPGTAEYINEIYHGRGDKEGLVKEWLRLSAENPEAAVPRLYLGMALEEIGDVKSAVEAYQFALQLNPALTKAKENLANFEEK